MLRFVKLYIVSHSPFLSDAMNGQLCLVMRREGPLVKYNEITMQHNFLGTFTPPVSVSVNGTRSDPKITAKIFAGCNLGKNVEQYLSFKTNEESFHKFDNEGDPSGFETTLFGVFIPEVLEMIQTKPLFGCIDILTREKIEEEKEIHRKLSKKSPNKMTIRKMITLRGLSSLAPIEQAPEISLVDLYDSDRILAHFQKKYDKELKKMRDCLPKVSYAK